MKVSCRCGQAFTIYADSFPHEMHCHACGIRFMARADGSIEEIHAKSLSITCRCGRQFVISTVQFPRQLHCARCDRRFNVLDTGETIDVEPMLPAMEAGTHLMEGRDDRIIERISPRAKLGLYEELERIDAQWRCDRSLYALMNVGGATILPTSFLSVAVGLGGIGLCVTLMVLSANLLGPIKGVTTATFWIALGLISEVLAVYIRAEAIGLQHAEMAWRRRREEVLITWTASVPLQASRKDDCAEGSFRSVRSLL